MTTAAAAEPASSDPSGEIYRAYHEASHDLSPVSQILAWLGYLQLHPDSAWRDDVRWKVRYLAALLTPEEEEILLAALSLEQLYDQILSIEDPALRLSACSKFIRQHPALLKEPGSAQSFEGLLVKLGEPDPARFIAAALQGKAPAEGRVAVSAAAVGQGAPPPAQGEAPRDNALAGAAPGAPVGSSPAPSSPEGASPEAQAAQPAAAAQPPAQPAGGELLAALPSQPGAPESTQAPAIQPAAQEQTAALTPQAPQWSAVSPGEREEQRYPRWVEATAPLSPEAQVQMWSTYLLLYPDTQHRDEITATIEAGLMASALTEQNRRVAAARVAALEAERAAQQAQVERMEKRVQRLETWRTRRLIVLTATGVLFLILLSSL